MMLDKFLGVFNILLFVVAASQLVNPIGEELGVIVIYVTVNLVVLGLIAATAVRLLSK